MLISALMCRACERRRHEQDGPQSKIAALIRNVSRNASMQIVLRALPDWLAEARQMQQAFETMSAMSDRELEDIGITRSYIPAIVARTYRRDAAPGPIEPT